ncbi:MAG: hypothetical protein U1B30_02780, partial [Pseudomonadota bacterium]|nr:hypothetical protein [Pseudomonadota bacterium]
MCGHQINRALTLLSTALLFISLLFCHASQAQEWPAPAEESLVLLEVRLANHQVTDLRMAYRQGRGVMVPLQQLSQLLGINIQTYPSELAAEGTILNKDRPFYLDLKRSEVTLSGQVKAVAREAILVGSDDIYIDSQLISQWLPFQLNIDLYASRATVLPTEELPFQSHLEREQRIAQTRQALIYSDPGYPRRETPYLLWDTPTLDQTLTLSHQRAPRVTSDTALHYTTYATLDLLYMESAWYLAGSDTGALDEFRLMLGRKDPEAQLLGPLQATEFAFGDINLPGITLLDRAQAPGKGALISNHPLSQQNQFDSHSFRGNLPPGWDVELYHNDSLLAFQQSRADGQYNFDDMPLLYGMNYFKLIFYGPFGERRQEEYRFMLGQSLTPPGQFNYRLYYNEDSDDKGHSLIDFDLGLNRQASLNFGIASLPLSDGQHDYSRFGIRSFFSGLSLYTDSVQDQAGGNAHKVGLQTRIGDVGLIWNHTLLTPTFVSADFLPSSDPIQRRDEVRFDSAIPPGWLPRIPASLQLYRDSYYSGEHRTQLINRLSSQLSGLSVTNQLRWNLYSNATNATDGDLQISSRLQRFGVRSSLRYTLKPESRWTNLNIAFNGPLTGQFRFNSDFIRSFTSNLNTYTFGINRSVGRFAVGTNLSYSSADQLTFNLTLSAGIGREPRQQQWLSAAQPMARSGISSLNVFLDNNLNGIRDPDEQPLDGIGFNVNGSTPALRTDANGTAFLTNLPIYQQTDLAIATDTLEDPLWKPQLRGIRLVPRPGHTTRIDFPITITSEIDGTVYLQKGSHQQELADVSVELVAADDSIVQNVTSAYDGFYVISAIQAGNYTLRVNPAQLQKHKLQSHAPLPIKVGNSGNFINSINMLLSTTEIQTVEDKANMVSAAEPGAAHENSTLPQNDNLIDQYHIVQKDDWTWKIARLHLGYNKYAADIYKLNPLIIPS